MERPWRIVNGRRVLEKMGDKWREVGSGLPWVILQSPF